MDAEAELIGHAGCALLHRFERDVANWPAALGPAVGIAAGATGVARVWVERALRPAVVGHGRREVRAHVRAGEVWRADADEPEVIGPVAERAGHVAERRRREGHILE